MAGGADVCGRLSRAVEEQREGLMHCVHCGFCLPACPTYNRLGDESDSPRGRLHLMRAVVDGRLDPGSDAFQTHIDRCLGCRACEPVCPSGVEYGNLVELAREVATAARPPGLVQRTLLAVFGAPRLRALFFLGGRVLRGTGVAWLGARSLPTRGLLGSARLGLAMLASSSPWSGLPRAASGASGGAVQRPGPTERRGRVAVLTGCVQQGLYRRVNEATLRVLEANGFEPVRVPGQGCCGALHAHGGALERARAMARANVDAFAHETFDALVVNAAGCGAAMKEYGHLLAADPDYAERAASLAVMVRDATELLASVGPRTGASVACSVAVDHPCHLLHAQRVERAPLDVLGAVPDLDVRVVEDAAECCGGAGIYGISHPELGGRIGRDKVDAVKATVADALATPNPGCMMQIGAGLLLDGEPTGVVHPIELLDESYRRAGFYR